MESTPTPHYLGASSRREPMMVSDTDSFPLDAFAIPPQYQRYLSHVLLPHGLIMDRIEKLACDILTDMPGSTPHMLVVLKGGSEFATDLTRAMRHRHTYSGESALHLPFTVDYIRVKSYEGTESTGNGERVQEGEQERAQCGKLSGWVALPRARRRAEAMSELWYLRQRASPGHAANSMPPILSVLSAFAFSGTLLWALRTPAPPSTLPPPPQSASAALTTRRSQGATSSL